MNISEQIVEFKFEVMYCNIQGYVGIILDDDLDVILERHISGVPSETAFYFITLNKNGCHSDCDGCFEPGNSEKCMRCAKGMRKV